jgi:hypothetical protein
MKSSRPEKLKQFSSISASNKSLFQKPVLKQKQVQKIDYADFCHHMNVIAEYKTMVISERAYNLEPLGRIAGRTDDGDIIVEIGNTSKHEADLSAKLVNGNMQHMEKYQRELSMEAANPGRGLNK